MANWNLPAVTSGYLDFVTEMNDKFYDTSRMYYAESINMPQGTMRFNRSGYVFDEWDGSNNVWIPRVIGLSGGGTGSSTPAGARTNLGLGSMSTQNSNAVAITGGTITGVAYNANDITSGIVALARGGTGVSLAIAGPGAVLISNGVNLIWDSGVNISQLNASALIVGTVPAARLPANVAYNNIDNHFVAQSLGSGTNIEGINSRLYFRDTSAPAGQKIWRFTNPSNGTMNLEYMQDDFTTPQGPGFTFDRAGGLNAVAFGGSGAAIHSINASNLTTGTVAIGRLGTNAPTGGYFLRSDNTWQPVTTASVDPVPSGLIGMFMVGCPVGWTRVAGLDNRFPLGNPSPGLTGGNATHLHRVDGTVTNGGTHRHHASLGGSASGTVDGRTDEETNQAPIDVNRSGPTALLFLPHSHRVNIGVSLSVGVSGDTDDNGNHNHTFSVDTQLGGDYPPYMTVVFCQKN